MIGPTGLRAEVRGEIHEYDDQGRTVRRTYPQLAAEDDLVAGRDGAVDGAETADDGDWIKGATWDLRDPVGWEPAEALDQLWRALDVEPLSNDAKLRRLCELLATPAWEAAPAALAEEAYAWLVEHRALARG